MWRVKKGAVFDAVSSLFDLFLETIKSLDLEVELPDRAVAYPYSGFVASAIAREVSNLVREVFPEPEDLLDEYVIPVLQGAILDLVWGKLIRLLEDKLKHIGDEVINRLKEQIDKLPRRLAEGVILSTTGDMTVGEAKKLLVGGENCIDREVCRVKLKDLYGGALLIVDGYRLTHFSVSLKNLVAVFRGAIEAGKRPVLPKKVFSMLVDLKKLAGEGLSLFVSLLEKEREEIISGVVEHASMLILKDFLSFLKKHRIGEAGGSLYILNLDEDTLRKLKGFLLLIEGAEKAKKQQERGLRGRQNNRKT